jgi:hypothetical protein
MSGCHCDVGCFECTPSDEEIRRAKREEIIDDFSYTLKRFGLVNKTVRHWWAQELEILLTEGKAAVQKHREEMNKEWDNYN